MKKFLILMTLFTAMCPAMQTYAMLGDANLDGNISAADAALTLEYSLNSDMAKGRKDVDPSAMLVSKESIVTAANASLILQKSLDMDYRFPATYIVLDDNAMDSLENVILALENLAIPNTKGISREILTIVEDEMLEYSDNTSYDIESGISKAQKLIATLEPDERQELKRTILTYCDVNDLEKLYDFFGFLIK